ncbi:hypothetical protein Q3G72_016894 [Acer saccharum]|nr:hypothetical protein Q3G72_016894 [Acer saccharum]
MTTSSMNGIIPEIRKAVKREMEGEMKREMEGATEGSTKRLMKRVTEPVTERVMEQVMERVMKRVMERVMERMMERAMVSVMEPEMKREMKREMKLEMKLVMKRLIGTLSTQDPAPADWNVNPSRTPFDYHIKKSEEVELQLVFANKFPDKIYTKDKIRDESDHGFVKIKLIDTISRKTVKVGPSSSIEIEIVVLDGDFHFEENENWTEMEFNTKIVHQRGYDKPLVKGKQIITLRDGVGTVDDLSFSDNSSWIRCKMFRLGARVVQSRSKISQVRIKEAITEAFAVKDYPVKSATTGPHWHPQFQSIHQGMQNYSNRASSSSPYESAYPPEIVQRSHVNTQLTLGNDNHQPLKYGFNLK